MLDIVVGALLGQIPRSAQRATTRDDGNFQHRVAVLQAPHHRSVSRLVDSRRTALLGTHRHIATLQAADDTVDSGEEVLLRNALLVMTCRDKGSLVTYVCYVGTRKAWRLLGKELAVDGSIELQASKMHTEDLLTLLNIGQSHLDLSIETSRAHKRLIQYIDTVGCCKHDDTRIRLEAIHLGK